MLMNQSLGICEWCAPVQGPSLFHALKACGIGNFQVDTGLYEAGIPMAFQEVRESYLAAAADAGMELSSASNMSLCDYGMSQPKGSEHCDACREIMEKSICALGAMQIPIFMVPSFFDGEITDEDSFRNTAEMLTWASKLAADNGVAISWENALTVEENFRMLELVNSSSFGIGFDTLNPHAMKGYSVPGMIRALAPHINMVHIKDGIGEELGMRHYGDGDSEFAESVKALRAAGFQGCIVSENSYNDRTFFAADGDPFAAIREDVKRFQTYFA